MSGQTDGWMDNWKNRARLYITVETTQGNLIKGKLKDYQLSSVIRVARSVGVYLQWMDGLMDWWMDLFEQKLLKKKTEFQL